MANIISASDVLGATGGGLYLSKDDKAELHNEQRPFWITNAEGEQDGQFGPQSVFYIREKDGTDAKLAFGVSPARKELAQKITMAIAQGADAVGPFYLGRWENGNRSGWMLTPEPTQPLDIPELSSTAQATPPAPKPADKPAANYDDDLPF